ncbi:hypothetical protein F4777DRAFT_320888 [Nemania sp. FL0916]|nr:hypothetical protein F4777DRAFT_320888 [Nemania sp. FL0916]
MGTVASCIEKAPHYERKLDLRVIYDSSNPSNPAQVPKTPQFDFVLGHGFGGDLINTWTYTSDDGSKSVFWPKDLLPQKYPQIRVLSFGYNTGEKTVATIRDNAKTMLNQLVSWRGPECEGRPIVFLGHCLGGLIFRQAMRFAQDNPLWWPIASNTKSLMFFGTPHGGADTEGWLRVAKGYNGYGRGAQMIKVLANNTRDLLEIEEDYRRLVSKYTIVNFIETLPMPGTNRLVVGKTSATRTTSDEGYREEYVTANHITMCKFAGADHPTFRLVCTIIKKAIPEAIAEAIPKTTRQDPGAARVEPPVGREPPSQQPQLSIGSSETVSPPASSSALPLATLNIIYVAQRGRVPDPKG